MYEVIPLTENEMWAAVMAADNNCDGLFFYGVKTTKIFCRPSCNAKRPLRKNVTFIKDVTDAINYGFRPCKKCRPGGAHT